MMNKNELARDGRPAPKPGVYAGGTSGQPALTEIGGHFSDGPAAMADGVLLVRRELGERFPKAGDEEQRVVAESSAAARRFRYDPARLAPRLARDPAVAGEDHDADETGPPPLSGDTREKAEELAVVGFVGRTGQGEPGRFHSGRQAERLDLESGILGQRRESRTPAVIKGLAPGVLGKGPAPLAVLDAGQNVREADDPERQAGERGADLPDLSRVRRGDEQKLVAYSCVMHGG
jgi:hypothetical protein